MTTDDGLSDLIYRLEQRLLDPEVRASADEVDALLDDDFREIGSSGSIYDKSAILAALGQAPGFDGTRTIADFDVAVLSETVALATYRIVENGKLRSSIWRYSAGDWRMVFHQGTTPR